MTDGTTKAKEVTGAAVSIQRLVELTRIWKFVAGSLRRSVLNVKVMRSDMTVMLN